ncbi:hypothetical protein STAS_21412 [Striga asiatica]|uniref:Uncharacterized protein n=1 Tax=Striga asiatica TaxID=4170 RepID=A0A5A7QHX6_STRAF|nr:hypothetical protein STAS_21412 [Striga asiatica]
MIGEDWNAIVDNSEKREQLVELEDEEQLVKLRQRASLPEKLVMPSFVSRDFDTDPFNSLFERFRWRRFGSESRDLACDLVVRARRSSRRLFQPRVKGYPHV